MQCVFLLKDGMSPLLWAAHIGDKDGIDRLLSFGADVNRQLKVCEHEIPMISFL